YVHTRPSYNDSTYDSYLVDCDSENEEFTRELESKEFVSLNYCNFAFMCGCVWGDDTSWKLRYIDLSQIPNKVLTITDKFGYWELPNSLTLQESISMSGWEPGHDWIRLCKEESINLVDNDK
ncbi:MAG TPA: hypothetical protein VIY47_06445, partial [Ignavibacteriaceae bacterium]